MLFCGLLLFEFLEKPLHESFYQANSLKGIKVADPFKGGGCAYIVERFRKAKAYYYSLFEIRHQGGKEIVPIKGEWIGDKPKRLRENLVQGYAINQKRIEERNLELQHLKTGTAILRRAIAHQALLQRYPGRLPRSEFNNRRQVQSHQSGSN
jgi:hypothetical protein